MTGHKPERVFKRDVHGWVIFDKPSGMTSTYAVSLIKRLFKAKKAGHAGTLDPLASGVLPIALGDATKTVPFVMDAEKIYEFTVRWGIETDTDDSEGQVAHSSDQRPSEEAIRALLPRFTGLIQQMPPRFSALKIAGERAYDLAREGVTVEMTPRSVTVYELSLLSQPDVDHACFLARCGKGTYVRALARDMGRMLGCYGHISALRRSAVGVFTSDASISLEQLTELSHKAESELGRMVEALFPVETALDDIPALAVSLGDAARLRKGQAVLLRGRDAPAEAEAVLVTVQGDAVALAEIVGGELIPKRVFNLANGLTARRPR